MRPAVRGEAARLAVPAALLGIYGWAVCLATCFGADGAIGPRYNASGIDWMVYLEAARAWLAGAPDLLADPVALTARINLDFAGHLSSTLPLHPWLYPPPFLLVLLPFARLPFALSCALFQALTFAAAGAAAGVWLRPLRRRATWAALALAPAASVCAVSGQNAFLTLALLLGGFGLRHRSSLAGGAVLGLLCYKPQFALLVPVALIALRDRRAVLGALASGAALAAFSAAVLGGAPWRLWTGLMLDSHDSSFDAWLEAGRLWGLSAWACARRLGLPAGLASMVQALATVLAAGGVYRIFRRSAGAPLGRRAMALLLTATLLAAPHASPYDLLLLNAAVLLLIADWLEGRALPCRPTLLLLPWAAPLLGVPHNGATGFAAPLMVLGVTVLLGLAAPAAPLEAAAERWQPAGPDG